MVYINGSTIIIESEKATLEDKLDLDNAIDSLIEIGYETIYLDLGTPRYLPSELMGLLMWKKKELMEKNRNIRISRISSNLKTVFENALLIDFFEIDAQTTTT
ncbi:MAG: hypothetical protein ACOC2H_03305 [Spirochaetota bacterium]